MWTRNRLHAGRVALRFLRRRGGPALLAGVLAAAVIVPVCGAAAQQKDSPPESSPPAKTNGAQAPAPVTIHIEVTAGEKNKPVEAASVYVRYSEPRKFKSAHQVEMNVKTTPEGKARVPYVPRGTVIIQVVAEGWKTFGKTFEITDDDQVIKIHLDRPHQWY